AGLPVSFRHDLYTPRYIRRPVVEVQETTGVLPPTVEEGIPFLDEQVMRDAERTVQRHALTSSFRQATPLILSDSGRSAVSSTPAQVRERKLGDLFEYQIEHPVTIQRNQSALVPIVLRSFEGRPVLLYNKSNRAENPLRCVSMTNTTGLTLEGGPVTVLEGGSYVGEAMLDTLKPDEQRLIPFAVELGVFVLDNIESHSDHVHHVLIRNGHLEATYGEVRQTTYTLRNKGDESHILYLEHPRDSEEWKLIDTPEPIDITENFWRFRLELPPRQ